MNTGGVNPTNNREMANRAMAQSQQAEMQHRMQGEAQKEALRQQAREGTSTRSALYIIGGVIALAVIIVVVLLISGAL